MLKVLVKKELRLETGLKKKTGEELMIHQKNVENKMTLSDMKLYAMNAGALGITTFTHIEDGLKILLLLITIGYTISKWVNIKKENEGNK